MQLKNIAENIVRLTAGLVLNLLGAGKLLAEFVRQAAQPSARKFRLLLAAGLLPLLLAGGCGGADAPRTIGSKWECTGKCFILSEQAYAKCRSDFLAEEAYDLFPDHDVFDLCMKGEGWEKKPCVLAGDPDCK